MATSAASAPLPSDDNLISVRFDPTLRRHARSPVHALVVVLAAMAHVAGCATRPVNPPIGLAEPERTYRVERPSAKI